MTRLPTMNHKPRPPLINTQLQLGAGPTSPPFLLQSRRDCVLQPRVASSELPWVNCVGRCQPQRGCGLRSPLSRRNPVGVDRARVPFPRVARCSQPWALSRNPVGIRPPDSSSCAERPTLREREQRLRPALESSHDSRCADRLPTILPLPWGEGWGEGERDARRPHRTPIGIKLRDSTLAAQLVKIILGMAQCAS